MRGTPPPAIGRSLADQLEVRDGDPDAVAKVRTLIPRYARATDAEIFAVLKAAPVTHGYRIIKTRDPAVTAPAGAPRAR